MNRRLRIVLVHGAGGSPLTWSLVAPLLDAPGRELIVVDHASRSHVETVSAVRHILDQSPDDALLVGHSYGGAVITDAARHRSVRGLVYIAAFAPDDGESIDDIIARHGTAEVFQRSLPSSYLIATPDKHLRPEAQRAMAVRADATIAEVGTSHAAAHAAPDEVAATIETALAAVTR